MRAADLLVALLAMAAIVGGRSGWDARGTAPIGDAGLPDAHPECAAVGEGWRDDHGAYQPWTAPVDLRSNGALFACPPQLGTVSFVLRGSAALGRHARAIVVVGGATVFDAEVATPQRVVLEIPARTPILVAFVNDLYRSPEEDRDLWVGPVEFATP